VIWSRPPLGPLPSLSRLARSLIPVRNLRLTLQVSSLDSNRHRPSHLTRSLDPPPLRPCPPQPSHGLYLSGPLILWAFHLCHGRPQPYPTLDPSHSHPAARACQDPTPASPFPPFPLSPPYPPYSYSTNHYLTSHRPGLLNRLHLICCDRISEIFSLSPCRRQSRSSFRSRFLPVHRHFFYQSFFLVFLDLNHSFLGLRAAPRARSSQRRYHRHPCHHPYPSHPSPNLMVAPRLGHLHLPGHKSPNKSSIGKPSSSNMQILPSTPDISAVGI